MDKTSYEEDLIKIGWTPLHTRLLAHRIGDGTANHYGHFSWSNIHMGEFVQLAEYLRFKKWGPIKSDKYRTKSVIIPKKNFKEFASLFKINEEILIRYPLVLLNILMALPREHQIQAILAFIVDDGSCKNWRLSVFEDQNQDVFTEVKKIWDSLFQNTSATETQITKNGTLVYHLHSNRTGILLLEKEITAAVGKYGTLANLWWKQNDFDNRVKKATNIRAQILFDTRTTKEEKKKIILNVLSEKSLSFKEIKNTLLLSPDRLRLLLVELINENKIVLISASKNSKYLINCELSKPALSSS